MGDLRTAHDVIDPDGLETALVELGEAGLQQVAQRLTALCPQFPVLGRPAAERRAARRWRLVMARVAGCGGYCPRGLLAASPGFAPGQASRLTIDQGNVQPGQG